MVAIPCQKMCAYKRERYTLTEVKAPAGHELGKKTTWQIEVSEQGKVSIDGQEVTTTNQVIPLEIENKFSSLPIRIRKYTMQNGKQVNLAEATFALQRKMLKEVTKLWQLKNRYYRIELF